MHKNHSCGEGSSHRRYSWRGQAFSAFAEHFGDHFADMGSFGGRGSGRGSGRGGRPGGGRQRVLDGAELRLVLLKLIAEQPRHGYELIKAIETLSGGSYAPSPGMIYPTLSMMADIGEVAEQAEANRKLYTITDAGRTALGAEAEAAANAIVRLEALAAASAQASERSDSAPVRRALRNLHMAVHARLNDDAADKATQLDIAGLLDEVAGRIERL